eukprot:798234-Prorocentrum_minimum.AAC.1
MCSESLQVDPINPIAGLRAGPAAARPTLHLLRRIPPAWVNLTPRAGEFTPLQRPSPGDSAAGGLKWDRPRNCCAVPGGAAPPGELPRPAR